MDDLKYIKDTYNLGLLDLIFKAASIHRKFNDYKKIQKCSLISIKTGACTEDCHYCSQSIYNDTKIEIKPLMDEKKVFNIAKKAKESGASRICMAISGRGINSENELNKIIKIIQSVSKLKIEICCSLGLINTNYAQKLKNAGLNIYNHNIDTSQNYYKKIVSTRNYKDRIDTINNIKKLKIKLCSGVILGLGENDEDRINLIYQLFLIKPESIPVNTLVAIKGTPFEKNKPLKNWKLIRFIATTRIMMPKAYIRLSAGRNKLSDQDHAICFLSGANSIFIGEKLLTTKNLDIEKDTKMLNEFGLSD